ncbi:MAG: flagellar biosynthesis anti-sigma factor FlgM [Planctomycetia bacterium]|nr:flagellar biosynthesis anti-sigma factor FlgM [Planctomycetia bacterium]
MDIYGTHIIHGSQGIAAPHQTGMLKRNVAAETKNNVPVKDEVEISTTAQRLSETREMSSTLGQGEIRLDLINRVRSEIASGTYDTPEKMDIAMEKMFNSIFG